MSLQFNGNNISDVMYNGNVIQEARYNGEIVYTSKLPSGTVVFESDVVGTYTVEIKKEQEYNVILVGGGGNGVIRCVSDVFLRSCSSGSGGSGACYNGNLIIPEGTYSLTVGGDTVFLGITAGRGGTGTTNSSCRWGYGGAGGTLTFSPIEGVTETSFTIKSNGNRGTDGDGKDYYYAAGASLYGGYGRGMDSSPKTEGYIKIMAV